MRRYTNRVSLLLSFALHIGLMLAVSPFLVNHFNAEKEHISADILKVQPEQQVRRRVLPQRTPLVPQASEAQASNSSPASLQYAPQVSVPKAPVHADVVPDIVTHADMPQTDAPSPVSNTSSGEDGTLAGPVVIERPGGSEDGGFGSGIGSPGRGGDGMGKHFAHGTGVSDVGLATLDSIDAGLGIFGTDVMPGHGLIGQVYVPGGEILHMPDFTHLTPIYTFVTANLDVPKREYTQGFPTPEMQAVTENFAIRFRGELAVDTPGLYHFGLYSDDGSKLYIDGTLVVDNDGIHPAMGKKGSITLTTGMHPVEIHYFQGPRHSIALQWFYQPPTGPYSERIASITVKAPKLHWRLESYILGRIVPPEIIYRPGKPRIPDALKKLQQRLKNIEDIGEQ